jgi:hypothetical protein
MFFNVKEAVEHGTNVETNYPSHLQVISTIEYGIPGALKNL